MKKIIVFVLVALFANVLFCAQPTTGWVFEDYTRKPLNNSMMWGTNISKETFPMVIDSDGYSSTHVKPIAGSVWTISGASLTFEATAPQVSTSIFSSDNLALTVIDTEYSITLTTVKSLFFRNRGTAPIRFSEITGKVAGPVAPWNTLQSGETLWKDNLNIPSMTLYFATSTLAQIIEIRKW